MSSFLNHPPPTLTQLRRPLMHPPLLPSTASPRPSTIHVPPLIKTHNQLSSEYIMCVVGLRTTLAFLYTVISPATGLGGRPRLPTGPPIPVHLPPLHPPTCTPFQSRPPKSHTLFVYGYFCGSCRWALIGPLTYRRI